MKIYKIAQENLMVSKEILPDRTRYFLVDDKGVKYGILTVQSNLDLNNYMMTQFRIYNEQLIGKGYGRKLMNEFLSDKRFLDKPIMLKPSPYIDTNYDSDIEKLTSMYKHFGFIDYKDGWLILRR